MQSIPFICSAIFTLAIFNSIQTSAFPMESSNKAAEESFENLLADSAKETNNARAAESGQKECMKR